MNLSQREMTPKPLSLKQRTSSMDAHRDATANTWLSVIGMLKLREFFITVDHFSIWKRHLAWAIADGKELRNYMTQRYSSSMVFMSLLLSTELSVLFSSAVVTTEVRHALEEDRYKSLSYWIGIFIIVSAILSLLGLVSTFTAWGMVSAVNEVNAHCVFRSSIGQYVADLPGHFIVGSIYTFSIWLVLFFFLLLPIGFSSFLLLGTTLGLFLHTIAVFSAFGRIIMHSGAMGSNQIFDPVFESTLTPRALHENLLAKARQTLHKAFSIRRQYTKSDPVDYDLTAFDEMKELRSSYPTDRSAFIWNYFPDTEIGNSPHRKRTDSLVKFDDGLDTNGLSCVPYPPHDQLKSDTATRQRYSFFSSAAGNLPHDWLLSQPADDKEKKRNEQVQPRVSNVLATWQMMSELTSSNNNKSSLINVTNLQDLQNSSIDYHSQMHENHDELRSQKDQFQHDWEDLLEAPQGVHGMNSNDNSYRYLQSVEQVRVPSIKTLRDPTRHSDLLQNTAQKGNATKHADNKGSQSDNTYGTTDEQNDKHQNTKDAAQSSELSSLLFSTKSSAS